MARFYRSRKAMALRPITATKNIKEGSSIVAAGINTVIATLALAVDSSVLANTAEVDRSCTIKGVYLSLFFYTESGGGAAQIPLVDWYIIKDPGGIMGGLGFVADGLPTPGSTGSHENKRFILHTEKGLAGQQAAGSPPMVFQGVVRLPKGMQRFNKGDQLLVVGRSNFDTKVCFQSIYKWYK